jgi:hypothetical protein
MRLYHRRARCVAILTRCTEPSAVRPAVDMETPRQRPWREEGIGIPFRVRFGRPSAMTNDLAGDQVIPQSATHPTQILIRRCGSMTDEASSVMSSAKVTTWSPVQCGSRRDNRESINKLNIVGALGLPWVTPRSMMPEVPEVSPAVRIVVGELRIPAMDATVAPKRDSKRTMRARRGTES